MAFSSSRSGNGDKDFFAMLGEKTLTHAASPALLALGGSFSAAFLVQLLTPADPIGKSWRFLKQLRGQVRIALEFLAVFVPPFV